MLSQRDNSGSDHPVTYYSRKLLPWEERYSIIEKECLAIEVSMCHFRTYLMGRQFTVETDHQALLWMDRLKNSNSRLTRWSPSLQPIDFTTTHCKGPKNRNPDCHGIKAQLLNLLPEEGGVCRTGYLQQKAACHV